MKGVAEQIRKWNVSYDGEQKLWDFIERLEELTTIHEIEKDLLPAVMSEVLVRRTLIWFGKQQELEIMAGVSEGFLKDFLPRRYYE